MNPIDLHDGRAATRPYRPGNLCFQAISSVMEEFDAAGYFAGAGSGMPARLREGGIGGMSSARCSGEYFAVN